MSGAISRSLLMLAASMIAWAGEDARPACTAHNLGQMWPDAANRNPRLLTKLSRCGQLYLCVRGNWRYRWETPSVRVDQLRRNKKPDQQPAGCEVEPEGAAAAIYPDSPASERQ